MRFKFGIDGLLTDLGCSMTSVTPYALCDYRCAYCVTGVQGASKPIVSAETAVRQVREYLANTESPPILLLGAISDAFPSAEREFGITRAIMTELVAAGVPFGITTKGTIILRDLDLLVAHGDLAYCRCRFARSMTMSCPRSIRAHHRGRSDSGSSTSSIVPECLSG